MRSKKWVKVYGVLFGILLLFNVATTYGQQGQTTGAAQGQTTDAAGDSAQKQEPVFKLEVAVIESVKDKIPDEKFSEIGKLKDQEFSEQQLSVTLAGVGFNADDIKTVLSHVRGHLKFAENVKKLAPIILSIDTVKSSIRKKEAELESIQSDEQKTQSDEQKTQSDEQKTQSDNRKKEIADELEGLRSQLKKLEQDFTKITGKSIGRNKFDQVSAILKDAYKKKQIKTIAGYFQEPVFKMEEAIIGNLEGKISDEKFDAVKNLKDREFSERLLSVSLTGAAFDKNETETVLSYVREHLKFAEAVKKAAPTAMLMHNVRDDIQKKEAELEGTHQKKQKGKVGTGLVQWEIM